MDAMLFENAGVAAEIKDGFIGKRVVADFHRRELRDGALGAEQKYREENQRANLTSHRRAR